MFTLFCSSFMLFGQTLNDKGRMGSFRGQKRPLLSQSERQADGVKRMHHKTHVPRKARAKEQKLLSGPRKNELQSAECSLCCARVQKLSMCRTARQDRVSVLHAQTDSGM